MCRIKIQYCFEGSFVSLLKLLFLLSLVVVFQSAFQPQQTRIEERLDDAILVLRNHAEGALPQDMAAAQAMMNSSSGGLSRTSYSTVMSSGVPSGHGVPALEQMVSPNHFMWN